MFSPKRQFDMYLLSIAKNINTTNNQTQTKNQADVRIENTTTIEDHFFLKNVSRG